MRINGRLEAVHKIIMEISLLIMEKSWNFDFEFLWEPWIDIELKIIEGHSDLYLWFSVFELYLQDGKICIHSSFGLSVLKYNPSFKPNLNVDH